MIKKLIIIGVIAGVSFAQASKDVDVLEYKLKYEDIAKKQIAEILSKIIKKEQFVTTVTVEITPEAERRTQQVTKINVPDNVDPTLWKIYGEDKKQFEEKIIESKHRISKVSAVIILDERIQEGLVNEIRDSILSSLKDISSKNLEIKRQRFVRESLLEFFEKDKNYIVYFVVIFAIIIFLFGPLRSFLKGVVRVDFHKKDKGISVDVKGISVKGSSQEIKATVPAIPDAVTAAITTGSNQGEFKREPFSFIRKENLENLIYIIQNESPDMISLVITYLKEDESAEVIKRLPLDLQTKVAVAMTEVKQTSEESVSKAEEKIKKKINFLIGGVSRFAGILEKVDKEIREDILHSMEKESPEIADKIKKEIFTFEDIVHIDDSALQIVLREIKTDILARALVNAPSNVIEKVKRNISSGAASLLQEEINLVGYITSSKTDEERNKIINIIKNFEEKGKLILKKEKKKLEKVGDLDLKERKVDLDYYANKESKNVLSLRKILKREGEKEGSKEHLFISKKYKVSDKDSK